MPILPLPQFEADVKAMLDEQDRAAYEALKAPKTIVVRYGSMKLVGEFPFDGSAKPGCGSKLVVRTPRGVELGEMLTSTCPNSGCSKSVSRQDMLKYIENSGGRDYPFTNEGKVLRIATKDDLDRQAALEQSKHGLTMHARAEAERLNVPIRVVEVEPILGGERLTVYYTNPENPDQHTRPDTHELARVLHDEFRTRIDFRQVGARDEARLTADYERCGQYCCCKNFLKVLKPVSMKSAKVQKATLDPLKISGRCGRLMCCLRYEDETYDTLRKRLPNRKSRVGTPEGDGFVIDSQILTQLVLVQLDGIDKQIAVPVEELTPAKDPSGPTSWVPPPPPPPRRGRSEAPNAGPSAGPNASGSGGGGSGGSGGGGPDRSRPPRPQGNRPRPDQPRPDQPPRAPRPEGDQG
ncbi:MAG: regulatory iron-sulfur-containing complex subunit RicT [Planctomycetota bacterium]|nr:regulatory iron-sulfur-containing complex subunit RicT [Planctomycetota bacterium]